MIRASRKRVEDRLSRIAADMERLGLEEYLAYCRSPRRILWTNFLGGIARGFGFTVGFAFIGALLGIVLQRVASANLPVIGEFLAEVVRMVQTKLY